MPQIPRQYQIEPDRSYRKYEPDQSLSEYVERAHCADAPTGPARRLRLLERYQEKPERQRKPQTDRDVRNQKARKEKWPERGCQYQPGIESPFAAQSPASQTVCGEDHRQHAQHEREART